MNTFKIQINRIPQIVTQKFKLKNNNFNQIKFSSNKIQNEIIKDIYIIIAHKIASIPISLKAYILVNEQKKQLVETIVQKNDSFNNEEKFELYSKDILKPIRHRDMANIITQEIIQNSIQYQKLDTFIECEEKNAQFKIAQHLMNISNELGVNLIMVDTK